jgi:formiminoglutamase
MNDLHSFLASKHFAILPENQAQHTLQIGKRIYPFMEGNDDWADADIIIIGCGDESGKDIEAAWSQSADAVRAALYQMYDWHTSVRVVDMGNLLQGATPNDSKAALKTILLELHEAGKMVIVLGGSHDLTLQQNAVYRQKQQTINAAVIDMLIDLEDCEGITDTGFLMDMLTEQPNYIKHYSHIGFQSYYTNPNMLVTLDKLRFDCIRLGHVRDHIEAMEPVLRSCDLLSVDMNAVRQCDAPFLGKKGSPNGLFGDEMCQLMRYAGMSSQLSSLGIYGYDAEADTNGMGAQLIAQMLWYFVDGFQIRKMESDLSKRQDFLEFHVNFEGHDAVFLKSKKTNRWWMQLPDAQWVPCSYEDYTTAGNGMMPERWLREQERVV